MSSENAQRDNNRVTTIQGVTDDANAYNRNIKVDPTTDRLKVNATVTGTIDTQVELSIGGDGRKVVASAGTAERLVASSTPCARVDITAETDNTGIIVIGKSTVVAALGTRRGTPLSQGDTYSMDINDLYNVYLDATVNGEGVTFTYYT